MQEQRSPSQKTTVLIEKNTEKATFLAHHDIFQQLNPTAINRLDHITTTNTYPPGRILYRPGEHGSALFLLKIGSVQLYHLSTDGRKLVTMTLEAGACFGELPLISPTLHHTFAETISQTQLYAIAKHDLVPLLSQQPTINHALLHIVAVRLIQQETQLVNTTFKSASARLAILLLELAHPQQSDHTTLVVHGLSHEALADRLGVYRETVTTALRELKDMGAIELGRKHITICIPEVLTKLAAPPFLSSLSEPIDT